MVKYVGLDTIHDEMPLQRVLQLLQTYGPQLTRMTAAHQYLCYFDVVRVIIRKPQNMAGVSIGTNGYRSVRVLCKLLRCAGVTG